MRIGVGSRSVAATVVMAAVMLAVAPIAIGDNGSITMTAHETVSSADFAFSVTVDSCGPLDPLTRGCNWWPIVGVVPAVYSCEEPVPAAQAGAAYSGLDAIIAGRHARMSAPGAWDASGVVVGGFDSPAGDVRLCLLVIQAQGLNSVELLGDTTTTLANVLDSAPPPTPTPTAAPTPMGPPAVVGAPPVRQLVSPLTLTESMRVAGAALRHRLGARFRSRRGYVLTCVRTPSSPMTASCAASWRHGRRRYRARVVITKVTIDAYRYRVSIRP